MIPFPKMHIATSVLNRISNTLEERGPLGLEAEKETAPVEIQEPPLIPSPNVLSQEINNELKTPMDPVSVDPELQEPVQQEMIAEAASGGSPFDGALLGAGSF